MQGEVQQKLDVYANEVLLHCLSVHQSIGILASEENEHPLTVAHDSPAAKYAVIFDPLDGSSNIDVAGTRRHHLFDSPPAGRDASRETSSRWVLQPGSQQVAAGYVVYGASTMLVYTVGSGVHGFTLDPAIGAYVLTHENIRMPQQGKYYSVNEANRDAFLPAYNRFLDRFAARRLGRPVQLALRSARWWPISIARCSKGASFCIRPR